MSKKDNPSIYQTTLTEPEIEIDFHDDPPTEMTQLIELPEQNIHAYEYEDEPTLAPTTVFEHHSSLLTDTTDHFPPETLPCIYPRNLYPTLNNRFVLEAEIARGGMGIIYRARDLRREEAMDEDSHVAVKVLGEQFRQYPDAYISLQRETKKAQQLAHPNIVTVHDFDRDGDTVYMTMELLEGLSLEKFIDLHRITNGLSWSQAWPIVRDIATGLGYAHQKGLIHSDMKPSNVFLTHTGACKILDFGITRAISPTPTASGHDFDPKKYGALTPSYASTEMFSCTTPDPRDDIFALGCITYELLTGQHPFQNKTAVQALEEGIQPARITKLTKTQWQTLKQALQLEQAQRLDTTAVFLQGMQTDEQASHPRRKKMTYGLAALLCVSLLGGGAFFYQQQHAAQQAAITQSLGQLTTSLQLYQHQPDNSADVNAALHQLQQLAPNHDEAQAVIKNYVEDQIHKASQAQDQQHWGEAEQAIQHALALQLPPELLERLNQQQASLLENQLTYEQALKQRVALQAFEQSLENTEFTPKTVDQTAQLLQYIQSLNLADPQIYQTAHQQLIEKLVAQSHTHQQAAQWEEGNALLASGLTYFPNDISLQQAQVLMDEAQQHSKKADTASTPKYPRSRTTSTARGKKNAQATSAKPNPSRSGLDWLKPQPPSPESLDILSDF